MPRLMTGEHIPSTRAKPKDNRPSGGKPRDSGPANNPGARGKPPTPSPAPAVVVPAPRAGGGPRDSGVQTAAAGTNTARTQQSAPVTTKPSKVPAVPAGPSKRDLQRSALATMLTAPKKTGPTLSQPVAAVANLLGLKGPTGKLNKTGAAFVGLSPDKQAMVMKNIAAKTAGAGDGVSAAKLSAAARLTLAAAPKAPAPTVKAQTLPGASTSSAESEVESRLGLAAGDPGLKSFRAMTPQQKVNSIQEQRDLLSPEAGEERQSLTRALRLLTGEAHPAAAPKSQPKSDPNAARAIALLAQARKIAAPGTDKAIGDARDVTAKAEKLVGHTLERENADGAEVPVSTLVARRLLSGSAGQPSTVSGAGAKPDDFAGRAKRLAQMPPGPDRDKVAVKLSHDIKRHTRYLRANPSPADGSHNKADLKAANGTDAYDPKKAIAGPGFTPQQIGSSPAPKAKAKPKGFTPHGGNTGLFLAPGTDYATGDEKELAARLDHLGKTLGLKLTGLSGHRTPQHSVAVGGFANDPHTKGEASDTPGVEGVSEKTLNQYGLTRPFGGAKEADHIQLLPGYKGPNRASSPAATTAGASTPVKETPDTRLTGAQQTFVHDVAKGTGLSEKALSAWALAEENQGAAKSREAQRNNNWLNIGYFDSLHGKGALQGKGDWSTPAGGAKETIAFLKGQKYGPSEGIRKIINTKGMSEADQVAAIARSGWASSGYGGGKTLLSLLGSATPGAGSPPAAGAPMDTAPAGDASSAPSAATGTPSGFTSSSSAAPAASGKREFFDVKRGEDVWRVFADGHMTKLPKGTKATPAGPDTQRQQALLAYLLDRHNPDALLSALLQAGVPSS